MQNNPTPSVQGEQPCPLCGIKIPQAATFCPYCGSQTQKLPQVAQSVSAPDTATPDLLAQPTQARTSGFAPVETPPAAQRTPSKSSRKMTVLRRRLPKSEANQGETSDQNTMELRAEQIRKFEESFPISSRTKAIRASMAMYNPKEVAEYERCGDPFVLEQEGKQKPITLRRRLEPLQPQVPLEKQGRAAQVATLHAQNEHLPQSVLPSEISERKKPRRWPVVLAAVGVLIVAGALVVVVFFPHLLPWL